VGALAPHLTPRSHGAPPTPPPSPHPAPIPRTRTLLALAAIVALLALAVLYFLVTMNLPTWSRVPAASTRNAVPLLRGFVNPNWGVFDLASRAMLETSSWP
jgi:hypothetical protein